MPLRIRPSLPTALALAATVAFVSPAAAQTSAPTATAPCAKVVTADEVTAAVGVAMQAYPPDNRGKGETECDWMARGAPGGLKTLAVSFYDMSAIKESSAPTGDGFYEMLVKAAEESTSTKREVIAGVGRHAAFVPTSPQTLAVVHVPDGVVRIVANGLTRAQTIAVAKAVATP